MEPQQWCSLADMDHALSTARDSVQRLQQRRHVLEDGVAHAKLALAQAVEKKKKKMKGGTKGTCSYRRYIRSEVLIILPAVIEECKREVAARYNLFLAAESELEVAEATYLRLRNNAGLPGSQQSQDGHHLEETQIPLPVANGAEQDKVR